MARQKSLFLSAFGTAFEIWKALVEAVIAKGGTDDDLRRILTDETLRDKIADLIVAKVAEATDPIFKVEVDYGLSLAEMIKAGRYDWMDGGITPERLPVSGEGKAEVALELVHLNRLASTDEVLAELDRRGLRPATPPEHLAFGAKFPDLQRQFQIVALGSRIVDPDGRRFFTCLDWNDGGRVLRLCAGASGWHHIYRFLALRK